MKWGFSMFRQRVAVSVGAAARAATATPATDGCFHCAPPLPLPVADWVVFDGVSRPLCCAGCLAAAELLIGQGFFAYYRDRGQQHA